MKLHDEIKVGDSIGVTLPRGEYSGSSMGNLPIGQGELVTPMQMVSAYSAIADGGSSVGIGCSTEHGEGRPMARPVRVVGLGGSLRAESTSRMALQVALDGAAASVDALPAVVAAVSLGLCAIAVIAIALN